MVHFIFLQNNSHLKEHHRSQRYDFCKNSSNPKSNKGEREADRGTASQRTPHVRDPRAEARLDRQRSRRRRGLGDGQGHHRAPHSIPHRMIPETLTLLDPRYLALANGGTAVVRGRPPASLAGDTAKENMDEHQHDLTELLGQE